MPAHIVDWNDVRHMTKTRRILPLLFFLVTAACGGSSPTSPTQSAPFSMTDLRVGTGREAVNGTQLTVHYAGWLYDGNQASKKGRQFDSSVGGVPFTFLLGAGRVIRGWDQGLLGMRVGGQRQLVIPPELAYGAQGAGNGAIPPNSTLVFDVKLLDVQG
jgi:FKBP-type peptidyl-prolyl cis-trans isomerase FkpA